ncbi:MAG: type II secretion system F family protein [Syntrophobacterales bacterium]|jgi:type II secretory pathway component PulF
MPSFKYRARDLEGKAITGLLEGDDKASVAEQIQRLGYIPVEIELEQKEKKVAKGAGANWADRMMRRVRSEEIIYLNRQLALVLGAGVPLLTCLRLMAKQTDNERLRDILLGISDDIEGGSDFSDAMSHYPNVFSSLYVSMVRAGEASGHLEDTLNRIANLQEYELVTKERVKAATRYPKLVIGALIAAFFVVVYFVIPTFARIFKQFGSELPLPTRVMIAMDAYLKQYWLVSLLGIVLAVIATLWWIQTPPGRYWLDWLKVNIPMFGPLMSKFALSRFSRIFSSLNASGLPIMQTLDISTDTVGNVVYARSLRKVTEEVKRGENLSDALARVGIFPPLLHQMVTVGETTGKLDEVLAKVSDYYDQDVEYAIKRFTTLIEPALLAIVAAFVFFFALSVFLPLFNLARVLIR